MQALYSTPVSEENAGNVGGEERSLLELVTPMLITFNEAQNLERTMRQLTWARRIVVIDSFSTDETLEILKRYPQAEVFQRRFDSFARQCNFGLGKIRSEWVLSIDADYILTDELIDEVRRLPPRPEEDGFAVRFKYCVWGKPLRGTLYPPRTVLYRASKASYLDDGHAHHVVVEGPRAELAHFIHHDDRKPLSRWTSSQARYVEDEGRKFSPAQSNSLSFSDRLRKKKVLAPSIILFYCMILHRGLLDGWAGWYYAFERMAAEVLLALRLIELENFAARVVDESWVREQNDLASQEARRLGARARGAVGLKDRLRLLKVFVPVLMLPYTLLVRRELYAGWKGWHSAYRNTFFELLLAIHLIERMNIKDTGPEERATTLSPSRPGRVE